ncbi:hypothetical protein SCOR_35650 [Sulfidibacter corallicola]
MPLGAGPRNLAAQPIEATLGRGVGYVKEQNHSRPWQNPPAPTGPAGPAPHLSMEAEISQPSDFDGESFSETLCFAPEHRTSSRAESLRLVEQAGLGGPLHLQAWRPSHDAGPVGLATSDWASEGDSVLRYLPQLVVVAWVASIGGASCSTYRPGAPLMMRGLWALRLRIGLAREIPCFAICPNWL